MNEEQLIATLQACYFGDKGAYNKILKEYKKLQQENKELKERINTYENPEDLTLFYMWLDEKAKDKIKELENRINKAIEYIGSREMYNDDFDTETNKLLNLLKGDKE